MSFFLDDDRFNGPFSGHVQDGPVNHDWGCPFTPSPGPGFKEKRCQQTRTIHEIALITTLDEPPMYCRQCDQDNPSESHIVNQPNVQNYLRECPVMRIRWIGNRSPCIIWISPYFSRMSLGNLPLSVSVQEKKRMIGIEQKRRNSASVDLNRKKKRSDIRVCHSAISTHLTHSRVVARPISVVVVWTPLSIGRALLIPRWKCKSMANNAAIKYKAEAIPVLDGSSRCDYGVRDQENRIDCSRHLLRTGRFVRHPATEKTEINAPNMEQRRMNDAQCYQTHDTRPVSPSHDWERSNADPYRRKIIVSPNGGDRRSRTQTLRSGIYRDALRIVVIPFSAILQTENRQIGNQTYNQTNLHKKIHGILDSSVQKNVENGSREKFGGFEKPFATSFMNLFGTEKFSGDTDDERHLLGLSRQVPIGDSRATSRPLSVEREQLLDPLARGQGRSGDAEGRRWNELVFFCSPCPLAGMGDVDNCVDYVDNCVDNCVDYVDNCVDYVDNCVDYVIVDASTIKCPTELVKDESDRSRNQKLTREYAAFVHLNCIAIRVNESFAFLTLTETRSWIFCDSANARSVWQNQKTFSTDHSTIKADDLRPYANPRPIPIRIMFFVSTGISHPIWTHRFELFAKFLAIPNTSPEVRRHTTLRLFRYAKTLIRVGRRRASLGDSDDRSGNELYPSNIRYKSDILSIELLLYDKKKKKKKKTFEQIDHGIFLSRLEDFSFSLNFSISSLLPCA
ncbi:hypothetical protein GEV33_008978 [Tenebrio molitor]|uniref:Uncharacterized protein n=1 Tax=Tenebrio molitor TaxID=7067 RepID=A0A8J6HGK3_TENMO|nr:hypothetical protein GEV33_008978 [Tenebrio molitor]